MVSISKKIGTYAKVLDMKVFIDILTPKQGMLFSKLSKRLRENGHSIFEVTREYREVTQLLSLKGIKATVVGKHGGENLSSKLTASTERIIKLTSIMTELQPDVAVSFSSPETSRVAFGLGIPHVCINDSPHAEAVARLTVPLATVLLTPKAIPKNAWTKFGIAGKRIIQYNALDSWAWLKDFEPDEKILTQLNLEESRPIVAFRPEESFASYLLGKTSKTLSLLPLIENLLKSGVDFQAVVLPRYETQSFLKEKLGEQVTVCESVVDAPSLLYYSSIFIGAGGTMTSEAALLGVPTFSCYPGTPYIVEKYLIKKRLIDRETSLKNVKAKVLKTLRNIESYRKIQVEKARKLTSSFEDPVDVIAETIENVC
jgi:predicted glycosyltransferase